MSIHRPRFGRGTFLSCSLLSTVPCWAWLAYILALLSPLPPPSDHISALLIRGGGTVFLLPVLYYTFVKVLLLCNRISHAVHFLQYRSLPSGELDSLLGDLDFLLGDM